jgi:hypothetical protein
MMVKGIVTLRSTRDTFPIIADIVVRSYQPGKKILYLHWVDYHKRFWTLDYDYIFRLAKLNRVSNSIADDIFFMRAFSRDNIEVSENWKEIFSGRWEMIILDSVNELYEEKKEHSKTMAYAIGKFVQACTRNDCTGIIIDRSMRPIHTYLSHISSVIIELDDEIALLKHPFMADISVPPDGQFKLVKWC